MQPEIYAKDPTTGIGNALRDRPDNISICVDRFDYHPNAKYKVFVQLEPQYTEQIVPQLIARATEYDVILAWDERVLEVCPNASMFRGHGFWIFPEEFTPDKQNEISFITSSKAFFPGHKLRQSIFDRLVALGSINEFSLNLHRSPPMIPSKNPMFEKAKFSVIIENFYRPNLFSEKILDALWTKTVPLYYGTPNIGEFFNEKGIITFTTEEELFELLETITPEMYTELEESGVLEDNKQRSLKYASFYQSIDEAIDTVIYGITDADNPTDWERGCKPPKP
tara:strand:+ start:4079 stop:4921 length:843 start_codon:yes stop_codon:yes gene_type:complete